MTSPNTRAQVPANSASNGADHALPAQTPASGPINVAAAPMSNLEPEGSGIRESAPAAAPDIMDTEQDAYARKRGYRNIDNLLDNPRRM